MTRRDVVTAGVLGTLAVPAVDAAAAQDQDDAQTRAVLNQINQRLVEIHTALEAGLRGPGVGGGFINDIRDRLTLHWRSAGKFPDFMEIGTSVFYDVYDWHVRHNQQIQIVAIAEQRFAIQFMFTQLIVRWEQAANYLGQPFDRGV